MSSEFQGLTSPRLIRILAFVQRGSHSLISSSNVTTRDQPWADHPETACDYTINELFNSHYFIVIRNERTWFRGEIKRAWGCPQEETCCREETDDWGSTTPLLSVTRAVYLLREETGYLIYSHTHREMLTERETRGNYPHTNTAASNGQMDAPKHWKNTPIKSVWRWIDALWHLFPQQRGTEVFPRANITYKIKKFRRLMVRELPRQEDIWKAISSKYRTLLSLGLRKYLKDWKDFDDNTCLPLQNKHAMLRKMKKPRALSQTL